MPTNGNGSVSVYVHIPFCKRKCPYCHFYTAPDAENAKDVLLDALLREWQQWSKRIAKQDRLASLYFGGGTPSLMGPARVARLISEIPSAFANIADDIEITLEANPEEASLSLMQEYAQAGVNRISFGVQAFDDAMLCTLQRRHSAAKAVDAVHVTRDAGIDNISIDLMYDLPGQTLKQWKASLDTACTLPVTHLSLYNLTIEPKTAFWRKRQQLESQRPPSETSLAMYEMAMEILPKAGFQQYEISAFARQGSTSRHNTGYWTARPFIGLGPSAYSFWEGLRFHNVAHLKKYCTAISQQQSTIDVTDELDANARRRELLVIALRLLDGVNIETFQQCHGALDHATVSTLHALQKAELLANDSDANVWKLTHRGILLYDTIAAELI